MKNISISFIFQKRHQIISFLYFKVSFRLTISCLKSYKVLNYKQLLWSFSWKIFLIFCMEQHCWTNGYLCGFQSSHPFCFRGRSNKCCLLGGSPGLVVMGGDSCSKGCEFESQHRMMDRHLFTFICCKNCYVGFEKTKIMEEEADDGLFFKKCCLIEPYQFLDNIMH